MRFKYSLYFYRILNAPEVRSFYWLKPVKTGGWSQPQTCWNPLEPARYGWSWLEPAGASWSQLEPAGASWSRLEPSVRLQAELEPAGAGAGAGAEFV